MCHVPPIIKRIKLQGPLNKNPLLLTIGFWFSLLLTMGPDCVIMASLELPPASVSKVLEW